MQKENLEKLLSEKASLEADLHSAVEAGNGEEISRLKQREKTIDSDIFSASVLALKAEIVEIEAQLLIDQQNIVRARELSKETDSLVVSQTSILRGEIKKLNDNALAKLVAVRTAEKQSQVTGAKLMALKERMSKLLQ